MSTSFARLRPLTRTSGPLPQRIHLGGQLYIGGERPLWYRVDDARAVTLRDFRLDGGVAPFEVYDEAEKVKIEQREQERYMVAMGLMAESATQPPARATVDLTARDVPAGARDAAVPSDDRGSAPEIDPDDPLVPPALGGDLTTRDLRR